jgi:hypothetical protein
MIKLRVLYMVGKYSIYSQPQLITSTVIKKKIYYVLLTILNARIPWESVFKDLMEKLRI